MTWNCERVGRLTSLWTEGLSAAQIAAELGGLTRNAVIGKVHRLGLAGRKKVRASTERRPRAPRLRIPRISTKTADAPISRREVASEAIAAVEVVPIGQRCALIDLDEDKCRWPVGDPRASGFYFCGGKAVAGLPYCGWHARLSYQAISDRRREPGRGRQ